MFPILVLFLLRWQDARMLSYSYHLILYGQSLSLQLSKVLTIVASNLRDRFLYPSQSHLFSFQNYLYKSYAAKPLLSQNTLYLLTWWSASVLNTHLTSWFLLKSFILIQTRSFSSFLSWQWDSKHSYHWVQIFCIFANSLLLQFGFQPFLRPTFPWHQ